MSEELSMNQYIHKDTSLPFLFLLSFFLISGLTGIISTVKADTGLVDDMVLLDQAYIPVLSLTTNEKLEASRKAMARLDKTWEMFKTKYYDTKPDDPQWKMDFDFIDNKFKQAAAIITEGKELKQAHQEIEPVRETLLSLRERNNISYYLDNLIRFHEPMEEIVLTVLDKKPEQITDKEISAIKHALPIAREHWQNVKNTQLDAKTYGLSSSQASNIAKLIDKEETNLIALEQSLTTNDNQAIIKAGLGVKPDFAKIFTQFGDFTELK